jgi:hypothetical protein
MSGNNMGIAVMAASSVTCPEDGQAKPAKA